MEVRDGSHSRPFLMGTTPDGDEIEIENASYSRPVTRDGAVNRIMGDGLVDVEQNDTETVSPPNSTPRGHKREISESQGLLPASRENLFSYSTTKGFRYNQPEELSQNGRVSPLWGGIPQTLNRRRRQRSWDLVANIFVMTAPLPFFALVAVLLYFDKHKVHPDQLNALNEGIKVAATLFPLVFSIVVGRAMVKAASWKVERGTSLGLLESLMGSRTVGGTIITNIRLRAFTLVSLGLIFLWLLSPIGGQAILRVLSTAPQNIASVSNVTFMNNRQPSFSGLSDFNNWFSGCASLFSASLLAPETVKNSSMDLWGNVKIPMLSSLSSVSQDENGWKQVPRANFRPTYSSLFGLPMSGIPIGNASFNVQSSHVELSCSNRTSQATRGNNVFTNPGLITTDGPFFAAQNITSQTLWAIGYTGTNLSSLLPNSSVQSLDAFPLNGTDDVFPGLLLYQDFTGSQNVTSIYCVPSQVYIESIVDCRKSPSSSVPSCAVTAQRSSLLPHTSSTITLLSVPQVLEGLTSLLPKMTQQLNHVDLFQNYISNPDSNTFIQSATWPGSETPPAESRFLNVTLQDFSDRLGQLINTYFQGSIMNSTALFTGDTSIKLFADSKPAVSSSEITSGFQNLSSAITVQANTMLPTTRLFSISYPWLAFYFLATLAMFLSAILSTVLSHHTTGRDYLGYVSSLAREGRFMDFPAGGAALDGLQRTRTCKDMRVRLGDVGDLDGGLSIGTGVIVTVGQMALGREHGTGPLDRRKLYL